MFVLAGVDNRPGRVCWEAMVRKLFARVACWLSPRQRPWTSLGLALLLTADLVWIFAGFPAASRGRIYPAASLPLIGTPILVLGAGVLSDREPSRVLLARLETALELYQTGKGSWILVSGDNRAASYNEPQAMRRWLVRHGVPASQVVSDFAGRRTYDSLKRARAVFGIDRLIIVTSDFHLARALFLARRLGLDAYGVPASTGVLPLASRLSFAVREFGARHMATWDAWFPPDTMLGPREATPDNGTAQP